MSRDTAPATHINGCWVFLCLASRRSVAPQLTRLCLGCVPYWFNILHIKMAVFTLQIAESATDFDWILHDYLIKFLNNISLKRDFNVSGGNARPISLILA